MDSEQMRGTVEQIADTFNLSDTGDLQGLTDFHTHFKGVAGFLNLDETLGLAHEAENLLDRARQEYRVGAEARGSAGGCRHGTTRRTQAAGKVG